MKTVILCGGLGTRLREETAFKPKPMVEIGRTPILLHIMNIYAHYGYTDFVLCLGYKGEVIREYFAKHPPEPGYTVEMVDTGADAQTGARLKRIEKHIDGEYFMATYGDAVAAIDIRALVAFAKKQGTLATLTAVHPHSKWGLVREGQGGLVQEFVEKPFLFDYVNGGFFVFRKEFFRYLEDREGCVLETDGLNPLVAQSQLSMFKHEGFWHSMDTYKDFIDLNALWEKGERPWVFQ